MLKTSERVIGNRVMCICGVCMRNMYSVNTTRVFFVCLSVFECVKFVVPCCEDGVDMALCLGDGIGSAFEDHILVCAAYLVAREENGDTIFMLQFIAVAYECIA